MKCEECQILIEEYSDGSLDPKSVPLMNSHVASCLRCAAFREALAREQEIYRRYVPNIDATPELWASIEARIGRQHNAPPAGLVVRMREQMRGWFATPRMSPAIAVALVIIAIGATVLIMSRLNSGPQVAKSTGANSGYEAVAPNDRSGSSEPGGAVQSKPPTTEAEGVATTATVARENAPAPRKSHVSTSPTPVQLVREAEQKYLAAIAMLSRDVNRHRSQLDPVVLARFDAALGDIDRTIAETRRVARENPQDPIALQYLLAAYSKKVDVLRGMSASTD